MLRQLAKNDGIVFVSILMVIMVIMTITIGMISLNVSQVRFSESEVRRVKSELIAHGLMAYVFANQITPSASAAFTATQALDGITYNMSVGVPNTNGGPNLSDPLTIQVTY
jgi:hypothetical protein